jgi:Tol biopolymer transport system component
LDLARSNAKDRLTRDEGEERFPFWLDDKRIVYQSSPDGLRFDINIAAADGSGKVDKLGTLPNNFMPSTLSGDKKTLLLQELIPSSYQADIAMFSLEDRKRTPLLHDEKYNEEHPRISPDGKWLAYSSDRSGDNEVYICSFADVNGPQLRVSEGGGYGPLWSSDSREIFYRNGELIMAVPVDSKPGRPKKIFKGKYLCVTGHMLPLWDISRKDNRLLMMKQTGPTESSLRKIIVVLNWFEELKQKAPAK